MADPGTAITVQGPSAGLHGSDLQHRLDIVRSRVAAARERATELFQRTECALAENRVLRRAIKEAISDRESIAVRREPVQRSEYAQMVARSQTMPVIEQAKGIIMAQSRCGPAEAFETLRRASQLSNVPVRELAAQVVTKAAGEAHRM